MPARRPDLQQLAKSQLFVLDLRVTDAPAAIGAHLGGDDATAPVLWHDAESELLVRPADTRVRLAPGFLLVELRVACDQVPDDRLVLPFRIGRSPNEAAAVAVSEALPRGNALLASRWGAIATPVVWHAVLRAGHALLARRKLARPMVVAGVYTLGKVLSFLVTEPVRAADIRTYFTEQLKDTRIPDLSTLNRRFLGTLPLVRSTRR